MCLKVTNTVKKIAKENITVYKHVMHNPMDLSKLESSYRHAEIEIGVLYESALEYEENWFGGRGLVDVGLHSFKLKCC